MGPLELSDLTLVAMSRGWRDLGPVTDIKSAILRLLEQAMSPSSAKEKLQKVHLELEKQISTLSDKKKKYYRDQLYEDLFYVLAFSRDEDIEFTRDLRKKKRTFVKNNANSAQIALIRTTIELLQSRNPSKPGKPSNPRMSSLARSIDVIEKFRRILKFNSVDPESLKKSLSSSITNSLIISGKKKKSKKRKAKERSKTQIGDHERLYCYNFGPSEDGRRLELKPDRSVSKRPRGK